MLPYIHIEAIQAGPVVIHVWGLMVSLGIIAGLLIALYLAKKYFLSKNVVLDLAVWMLIGALVMSRIFYVFFYNPSYFLYYPWHIFKFWQGGASSLGGFFGAAMAIWLFAKFRKFSWNELLPYFDISAVGLWLGWGIGRIGCFLTHQHPGIASSFFLAVNSPCKPPSSLFESQLVDCFEPSRLDVGIIESFVGFLLFAIFFLLFVRLIKKRWGLVSGVSILVYSVIRFFLDFLRKTGDGFGEDFGGDIRYLHLTPAQWGMLVVFFGLTLAFILGRIKRTKKTAV